MRTVLLLLIGALLTACGFNKQFYKPNPTAVETPVSATSHYIYTEKDSVHILHYRPNAPKASMMILHGNAGNLNGWSEVADLFYLAGYEVFIMDYPGFGNSSGKARHKAVFSATDAVARYFNQECQSDKRLLLGFSLGGNLALKVATDHPDYFSALCMEGAFDSQVNVARKRVPKPFRFMANLFVKNHINGAKLIQSWTKPLLIIHSKDDQVCPYEMGVRLHESAGSTQKELWTIKGPHLSGLGRNFDQYMLKVEGLMH